MIFSILYYVSLIIYTKLRAFKKSRDNLKPNTIIVIGIITTFLFLFDCYNIYTNPYFMSKKRMIDQESRKYSLILFIGIFGSITLFLFSDYQRKQYKNIKPSRGFKGPRGKIGEPGKAANDVCDKRQCREDIIFNKVLNTINNKVYSTKSHPSSIKNDYIKNKIKLIISSDQFNEYQERTNFDTTLKYVLKNWEKCIDHILKHPKGRYFLENRGLDDNDFDYLLNNDNDKSPFDEIKHYDMWYWGEPESSKIKVQYRCDVDFSKGGISYIKELESNQYDLIWRSSTAKQTKENQKGNVIYNPYQNKGNNIISIYRPKILTTDKGVFYPTSDLVLKGDIDEHKKQNLGDVLPESERDPNNPLPSMADPVQSVTLLTGDVINPDGFELLYSGRAPVNSVGEGKDAYSFWKPVLNAENQKKYECSGIMVSNNLFHEPPSTQNYVCPPKSCIKDANEQIVWSCNGNDGDINVNNQFKNVNFSISNSANTYNEICTSKDSLKSQGDWKYLPKYNDEKYSITAKLKNKI